MTVTFHASTKGPNQELLGVKSEADEAEVAWADFGAALALIDPAVPAGVQRGLAKLASADQLAVATGVVQQTFPGAQVVQAPPPPAAPPASPWGNPPVPPFQPGPVAGPPQGYGQPAPQMPGAAAPVCQHGQKIYKEGFGKQPPHRPWKAWFCPAGESDPTRCEKEWIR